MSYYHIPPGIHTFPFVREKKIIKSNFVAPLESHNKIHQITKNGNKSMTTDTITSSVENQMVLSLFS